MSDLIPDKHLKIESYYYPERIPGGQYAVDTANGIKVTHIPTEITAMCHYARSQVRNKKVAIGMIEAALTDPNLE